MALAVSSHPFSTNFRNWLRTPTSDSTRSTWTSSRISPRKLASELLVLLSSSSFVSEENQFAYIECLIRCLLSWPTGKERRSRKSLVLTLQTLRYVFSILDRLFLRVLTPLFALPGSHRRSQDLIRSLPQITHPILPYAITLRSISCCCRTERFGRISIRSEAVVMSLMYSRCTSTLFSCSL